MLPFRIGSRTVFAALFLACVALMAVGYYLEYVVGLEPCPLCITQRFFIVAAGLTALAAALHAPGPGGLRAYAAGTVLFCAAGAGFASRHVWLQSLPADQAPACGPGIGYILETFPPLEALEVLLRGDGNCAEVDGSLLGLSIPAWTLLAFIGMGALAVWILCKPRTASAK